jgi:hypothetical protein
VRKDGAKKNSKHLRVRQASELAVKDQFAFSESPLQSIGKLAAENPAEHLHRQEEVIPRMHPSCVVGRQTAARDHAMDVRMSEQVLSPCVQNAEETDFGAQVLGVSGNLQQRLSASPKQQVINDVLVLKRQSGELMRQREDDMKVTNVEQFFRPGGQPLVAGIGLALWAMAISAGAV